MAHRKYSNKDNKKGNMKREKPSAFVRGMAAIDRGMSRFLTGQVAPTNVQKAYKKAGGK